MALSDDQKALLRLLAQREQGYDDIAALKGMSVEEVREEVRAALAAMEAPPPEPPAPPPPTPEPAPAPEPAPTPQASPATPKAQFNPRVRRPQRPAVPVERRRLLAIAGGALALVAVVLGAVALIGGGSDSGSSSAAAGESELTSGEEGKVTQAVLSSADGGEASGRAIFGRVGKEEIVLQVTAEDLEPTAKGQSYTVWLYRTPKLSLRVGSVPVGESGKLGARFSIPEELLAYVASGAFNQVYVSRTSNAAYQREVAKAKKEKSLPRYTGETVLTGEITGPIAKAGEEEEEGG